MKGPKRKIDGTGKSEMFEIGLNDALTRKLEELPRDSDGNVPLDEIERYTKRKSIPVSTLREFYEKWWRDKEGTSLEVLLTPLNLRFKEKYEPGKSYSKEFREQLETLKLRQQELEYQQLIRRYKGREGSRVVASLKLDSDEEELTPAQMNKQIKEQITTVFNILLSVVSVVFAIWYWSGSSMNIDVPYRVLLCLFFGILVLVAEVVVYNSYLNKIEEARALERSKKEKKKVLKKL